MVVRVSIEDVGCERPVGKFMDLRWQLVRRFERAYLELLYASCGNNLSAMARQAGMGRSRLRCYLRRHGIGKYAPSSATPAGSEMAA